MRKNTVRRKLMAVLLGAVMVLTSLDITAFTALAAPEAEVSVDETAIAEDVTDAVEEATDIVEDVTDAAEEVADIAGNVADVTEEAADIAGDVTDIAEEATEERVTAGTVSLTGEGTEASPYLIASEADLAEIEKAPDKAYKLTADIEIRDPRTPIGSYDAPFSGLLDGDGHTISELTVTTSIEVHKEDATSYQGAALIGRNSGTIRNLNISNALVNGSAFYTGVVVAYNTGKMQNVTVEGSTVTSSGYAALLAGGNAQNGDIRGCETKGTVTGSGARTGGLVADNRGKVVACSSGASVTGKGNTGGLLGYNLGILEDSRSTGKVVSTSSNSNENTDYNVGGLVGYNGTDAVVRNCTSSGEVVGSGYSARVGGLIGYNKEGTIEDSRASGNVESNTSYGGGFCGYNNGTITRCLSEGNLTVRSSNCFGGFVGENSGTIRYCGSKGYVKQDSSYSPEYMGGFVGRISGSGIITNCYALGNVTGYRYIGGFVGYVNSSSSTISNCYSVGSVSSSNTQYSSYYGGFAAYNYGNIQFASCYYDMDTSGKSDTGTGEGKSTADMKKQETYSSWNFSSIWEIDSEKNNGYPYLKWEDTTYIPVEGVTLSQTEASINIRETLQLTAQVTPDNANVRTVKWKSSKESVATVDANGLVTALKGGTATITVTTDRGSYVGECIVTVIAPKHTVKFETDGGTAIPSVEVYEEETVTRPAEDPSKTGYEFHGWFADAKFTKEWDFENDTVTADLTLYARWFNVKVVSAEDCTYTGSAVIPEVKITYNNKELVQGTDYTVSAINNINAGQTTDENPPTAQITYSGTYSGETKVAFNILPYDINGNEIVVEVVDADIPEVKVSFKGTELVNGTDYTFEKTGRKYGELTGKGNFKGSKSVLLDGARISKIKDYVYTGYAIVPDVTITYNGYELESGYDYYVEAINNVNAAQSTDENPPTVQISYRYYEGDERATFNILPYDISGDKISIEAENVSYTGSEVKPNVTVDFNNTRLVQDKDYKVEYVNNVEAGIGTVRVTGMGNFTGTKEKSFVILLPETMRKSILNTVVLSPKPQVYTGGRITPQVEVKDGDTILTQGVDYVLEYYNNIETGKALVIVVGAGNYTGRKSVPFSIVKRDLNDNDVIIADIPTQTFTGYGLTPKVRISINGNRLEEGVDYTLKYSNNKNATSAASPDKKATVTITGIGSCKGTRKVNFNISTATFDYRNGDLYVVVSDVAYNKGKPVKCAVEIMDGNYKLVANRDYTLTFRNNTEIADKNSYFPPTVTITGKGNYAGASMERKFRIYKKVIGQIKVSKIPVQMYTGSRITPPVTVTTNGKYLYPGYDYSVTYGHNVNAGKGTVYITGMGEYGGIKKITFTIKPKALTDVAATIDDIGTLNFTGGKQTPNVVVWSNGGRLEKGRDYTVTYQNNVNVAGVADKKAPTVIVKGKGNYKGTIKKSFTIAKASLLAEKNPDIKINVQDAVYQNGKPVVPSIVITDGSYKLKLNKDYTLNFKNNTERAEEGPEVIITGCGNYLGESVTVPFRIASVGMSAIKVDSVPAQTYTGFPITPSVVVSYQGIPLKENVDYRIEYGENILKGTGEIYVIGMGDYAGTKTIKFKIK